MLLKVDANEITSLERALAKSPEKMGLAFNEYLHKPATMQKTENAIKAIMPMSARQPKSRKGKPIPRAKEAKSLTNTPLPLGFKTSTKRRYNYLRFPNEGTGTSAGKAPKEFFEKGLTTQEDKLINDLLDIAENILTEL